MTRPPRTSTSDTLPGASAVRATRRAREPALTAWGTETSRRAGGAGPSPAFEPPPVDPVEPPVEPPAEPPPPVDGAATVIVFVAVVRLPAASATVSLTS